MTRQCIVCKKIVIDTDVQEHLSANHLGPHYFWFNGRKFRTMAPSMTVAEIKKLADEGISYQFFEERDGKWIYFGDGESVDLTRSPHFFAVPPATMYRGQSC